MIIPIRCFSCNNILADKWNYYKQELYAAKGRKEERYYMDGTQIPQTVELTIMNRLGLKRPCCRKQFLTHVDLIEKI
jgi:DNA-directed RNA polymerases I, II, and III subunit RPABC5